MRKLVTKVDDMFKAWQKADDAARIEGVKRLGLPKNNTAQDRAKAMGFSDETYYHGTNKSFDGFDINKSGDSFSEYEGAIPRDGIWMTDNPSQADWYADIARKGLYGEKDIGNSAIYPLKVRSKNPYKVPEQDWLDEGESIVDDVANMRKKGYDSTQLNQAEYTHIDDVYPNGASNKQISEYWNNTPVKQGANHVQSYSPTNVRSPLAHFNPKYAGIGAGSILSANLMADELDLEHKPKVSIWDSLMNTIANVNQQQAQGYGDTAVNTASTIGNIVADPSVAAELGIKGLRGTATGLLLNSGSVEAAEDPNFLNKLTRQR